MVFFPTSYSGTIPRHIFLCVLLGFKIKSTFFFKDHCGPNRPWQFADFMVRPNIFTVWYGIISTLPVFIFYLSLCIKEQLWCAGVLCLSANEFSSKQISSQEWYSERSKEAQACIIHMLQAYRSSRALPRFCLLGHSWRFLYLIRISFVDNIKSNNSWKRQKYQNIFSESSLRCPFTSMSKLVGFFLFWLIFS